MSAIGIGNGLFLFTGTGSPEGVVTANVGSLYCQTDGGSSSFIWGKSTGIGNTGWIVLGSGSSAVVRRTPTDANTNICWTLDEVASPWANTGTAGALNLTTFSGTPRPDWTGLFTNAISLTTAILTTGNTSVGEPSVNAATMSAWVKLRSYTSNGIIVHKNYRNNNTFVAPFSSLYLAMNSVADGSWAPAVTVGATLRQSVITAPWKIPLEDWTLLALTYDGTNMRSYINGTLAATSGAIAGGIDYGTHGPWDVGGASNGGASSQVDGVVDDVRVESVVRSQSYFRTMYKAGVNLPD